MASLQLSALQEKKLNPNAEPYVYLHKSLISPNPYGALSPYYPSQLCYHLAHFQSSIYRNYWCGLPYTPLGRLAACIPPSTNSTCRSDFHGQKAIIKPKSTVTAPKVEKEPWKPKTHRVLRRRCFPCRFEARKAPIPKPKVQPKDESSLTFDDPDTETGRTTVMIKNIPGRFTRKMILELLDNHCKEENEKAASSPPSEYDFLYLPIDFRQKLNLGYAFVNFTTSRAAQMFYKSMNNFKWVSFGSKKVCEITYAAIQGKDALVMHFKNKNFKCNSEMYLPVLLSPARNGSTSRPFPTVVGNRRAPFVNTKGHEERFHSPSL